MNWALSLGEMLREGGGESDFVRLRSEAVEAARLILVKVEEWESEGGEILPIS